MFNTLAEKRKAVEELLNRWCDALESGQYNQGKHALCSPVGSSHEYCCLGVACELFHKEFKITREIGSDYRGPTVYFDDASAFLPPSLGKHLGSLNSNGAFLLSDLANDLQSRLKEYIPEEEEEEEVRSGPMRFADPTSSLSSLNDLGVPFSLIAQIIRSRPKSLFEEGLFDDPVER